MEAITRNVSDIPANDLQALEHLIGAPLQPSQQVIVQVVEKVPDRNETPSESPEAKLPDWFNIYEGLSDDEIDRLEQSFERLDLTRD